MKKFLPPLAFLLLSFSLEANPESWYEKKIEEVEFSSGCDMEYGTKEKPIHYLQTPDYFIGWCKRENDDRYNLIAISAKENKDWDSCGSFIEVRENGPLSVTYIVQGAVPYGKPYPLSKFWTLDSLDEEDYEFLKSDVLATNKAIYYG